MNTGFSSPRLSEHTTPIEATNARMSANLAAVDGKISKMVASADRPTLEKIVAVMNTFAMTRDEAVEYLTWESEIDSQAQNMLDAQAEAILKEMGW